jgi:hypothetical protein
VMPARPKIVKKMAADSVIVLGSELSYLVVDTPGGYTSSYGSVF